jgi:hypothetical protein
MKPDGNKRLAGLEGRQNPAAVAWLPPNTLGIEN